MHGYTDLNNIFKINKGEIVSPSDSDGFGEEVIYSQESPKRDETFRDFDWEKNRFVEDTDHLCNKTKTLSLGKSSFEYMNNTHNKIFFFMNNTQQTTKKENNEKATNY